MTVESVVTEVKRALLDGGGFLLFEGDNGSQQDDRPSWFSEAYWEGKEKMPRQEEKIQQEHLKHCTACREATIGSNDITKTAAPSSPSAGLVRTTLSISGMTCASCSTALINGLTTMAGVKEVSIDLLGNSGTVIHNDTCTVPSLIATIEDIGYSAEVATTELLIASPADQHKRTVSIHVAGIFCPACPEKLNAYLSTLPLIPYTPLSTYTHTTTVVYSPGTMNIRRILEGLSQVSPEYYPSVTKSQSLAEKGQKIQQREVRVLQWHFVIAFLFAIPTFIIGILGMVLLPHHNAFRRDIMTPVWGAANKGTIALWPLATVVQFGAGRLFYERAFSSIRPLVRRLFSSTSRHAAPSRLTWRSFLSFGSMDLLVVLSTTTSYFASIAMLILDVRSPPDVASVGTYFDSCVFLIMFILMGRCLEAYAKSRTTNAVSLLGSLRPETALLIDNAPSLPASICRSEQRNSESPKTDIPKTGTPSTISVPVDHLEIGDHIVVPPGSLPPTDGIIIAGHTTFDEASLTGEAKPVVKALGDEVFTGTINKSGAITIRVTSLGRETMLEKIISAVSDASARKAPIEKLAERLTGVFVPIIVYLSLFVVAIWLSLALTGKLESIEHDRPGGKVFFALEFAIATLVVACPCGIGLAVPCANAVGNGIAAKAGILAAGGGEAFLGATQIGIIAVDKTGTLTVGKSQVRDESWSDHVIDREILKQAIAAVEGQSTHPLALGLVEFLGSAKTVDIVNTEEIAGRGIKATLKTKNGTVDVPFDILIGSLPLMDDYDVEVSVTEREKILSWQRQAKSVVLVAVRFSGVRDYTASGMFSLSDPPRSDALRVISDIKKRGIDVEMLTGDNEITAQAVAMELNISPDCVHAGVGPEGKAEVIRQLQARMRKPHKKQIVRWWRGLRSDKAKQREVVMFVGDGINDSVALAAADVSVAMGHGSQSTLASADFVLLNSTIGNLLGLMQISRKVYNRQRLNLLWAIIFNVVCLPFAAGLFYPAGGIRLSPVWSAALMACSSVSVVLSSLALKWGL